MSNDQYGLQKKAVNLMIDSVFPKHDKNNNGKLDYLESRSFMKETLKNLDQHTFFSDEKFRLTFRKYDKDNSNELDKKKIAALVKDMLNITQFRKTI